MKMTASNYLVSWKLACNTDNQRSSVKTWALFSSPKPAIYSIPTTEYKYIALCAYVLHMHCLPSITSQTRLLLFNKCLWLYKQKIKSHHSSARSAISLASLTASASRSLFSSPVFCSMFATWNLTVDISQPISAAMRV